MKRLQLALAVCGWNSESIYICIVFIFVVYSPIAFLYVLTCFYDLIGLVPPHHASCLLPFVTSLSSGGYHLTAAPREPRWSCKWVLSAVVAT